MNLEHELVRFVSHTAFEDLPPETLTTIKNPLLTVLGTTVTLKDGREFFREIDIAPGFPGNPLTKEEQETRFQDCIAYANKPLPEEKVDGIVEGVSHIERLSDIRALIGLLLP